MGFKRISNSITNSNERVRLWCMRNLNYSEGVGLTFSLFLNPAIAGCRDHKKVVSHVISNIWEKNFLSLQERVKILLQSVEVDAVTLHRYQALLCLSTGQGCLHCHGMAVRNSLNTLTFSNQS